MTISRLSNWLLCLTVSIFLGLTCPVFANDDDDGGRTPTLADIHKILLEAAGYQSDTPPTAAEQTVLLDKALAMLKKIPPVYHGQLKVAKASIEAALSELSTGDTAHKAKGDIYDADDAIKSIM